MSGNEPAFPTPQRLYANGDTELGNDGMTLRDWFASMALQGILSNPADGDSWRKYKEAVPIAYLFADEMLEARKEAK